MSVRVTAGVLKGMAVDVPSIARPTTSRVRTALFDAISSYILRNDMAWSQLRSIDCFAGSGVLSMEAISRGCASCDCVEKNRNAYKILQKNVLNIENIQVFHEDFMRFSRKRISPHGYNLFFIDPPYDLYDLSQVLQAARAIASQKALYAVEVSSRATDFEADKVCEKLSEMMNVDISALELIKSIKIAGSAVILFAQQ